ncbi:DUF2274 domain-containing protein [Sphingobium fuliginis]|uniref:DUF2274 domain-containing protein n=1 Tax=Sphingobium fuliginis ATCC 27551 TaxID=1208342 RepID=A0A5B8CCF0_SPHSA|nr:DUF2274 domain-containing protein [Sphingobium fuliginis]QDC37208.1 DUF2274 domain-containing protein [Sphingobium fuliginis ATCC 27551]
MADLKLPKLPDRTSVKLTITMSPGLKSALDDYAAMYAESYDTREPISELIPAILMSFLDSDRAFQKARAARRGQAAPRASG